MKNRNLQHSIFILQSENAKPKYFKYERQLVPIIISLYKYA